jgi:hypothetical protein
MYKILYHLFIVSAHASPGSGHSHADEDAMAGKVVGIIVILIISAIGFMFLSKKKK